MPSLSRLLISSLDKDEILNLQMLRPLSNLKLFWLAGKLEGGLKKDPIGSFSYMLNLVNLVITGAYDGEQLTFHAGWFPKLNLLQLADMEHLNWIEIEDGSMVCLCQLELVGLRNLNEVPKGIRSVSRSSKRKPKTIGTIKGGSFPTMHPSSPFKSPSRLLHPPPLAHGPSSLPASALPAAAVATCLFPASQPSPVAALGRCLQELLEIIKAGGLGAPPAWLHHQKISCRPICTVRSRFVIALLFSHPVHPTASSAPPTDSIATFPSRSQAAPPPAPP
ncbi:hypothetical protein GUJ93_ZPchr0012g20046 [Zizania palustris]|uniref:Uncharacterized protein n=1 Tax=Zizania palustris TaxID=103762 RepID=A0A8J6BTU9_ZIZPA|nr:hypothetical protein GUJ93_ZPchr0012g20046 [Zizania palustris]